MNKCDFCGSLNPTWRYPARSFEEHRDFSILGVKKSGDIEYKDFVINWGSEGDWAACEACHALIQRGDRERLTRRAAKRHVKTLPMSVASMIRILRPLHDDFWKNREGDPRRIDDDD